MQRSLGNARDDLKQSTRKMFEAILAEIKDLKAIQAQKIAALHERLAKIEEVMGQVHSRLKEAEGRNSNLEEKEATIQQEVAQLRKSEHLLGDKLHDLENYDSRSNLRIIGVAVGIEGQMKPEWVHALLKKAIPELTGDLTITRAHCVSAHHLPNAKYPCTILVHFADYQVKHRILFHAIEKRTLSTPEMPQFKVFSDMSALAALR
ncbi:hypothetical protein NDU88_001467 [Pleurodeles waltl]|uniref:Uncharacterized protein n=1 Tax=Pleurodeles waltl TaxID=8319 RepID=A0AAV7W0K6_PLEWA|nr:hypothetical protein NDU88_001467 [Pleurodeles waltl]